MHHSPFFHSDHLVIKVQITIWAPPLKYPLTKLRYPLMYTSKHHLVPVYICMYYKYLEYRKPSLWVSLDSRNHLVCQMKCIIQDPDFVVSTSLLLYYIQIKFHNFTFSLQHFLGPLFSLPFLIANCLPPLFIQPLILISDLIQPSVQPFCLYINTLRVCK